MKLICSGCEVVVPARDISIRTGIAKCEQCDEVMNVFAVLGLPDPQTGSAQPRQGAKLARPKRLRIAYDSRTPWTARWRWFHPNVMGLLLFCIVWDVAIAAWFRRASGSGISWIYFALPAAVAVIGAGSTYLLVAMLSNTTVVSIDDAKLQVRQGPVYWRGNRDIPVAEIDQLYCRRRFRSKNDWRHYADGYDYELWAVLKSGGEIRLTAVLDLDEGRFLEEQIEARLQIAPRPVVGECADGDVLSGWPPGRLP